MAGVGEQALVRAHQRLDAFGGEVEAGGQGGDLVAALHRHAAVERALAKGLDPALERLEAARQAAHERVRAHRDGEEQHHDQHQQAQTRRHAARQDAGEQVRRRAAALAGLRMMVGAEAAEVLVRRRGRVGAGRRLEHVGPHHVQRAAVVELDLVDRHVHQRLVALAADERVGRRDPVTLLVFQRHRHAQALRPVAQRLGLHLRRRGGRRQRALDQVAPGRDALVDRRLVARMLLVQVALHEPARRPGEQRQGDDHGEPDAQVEGTQDELSAGTQNENGAGGIVPPRSRWSLPPRESVWTSDRPVDGLSPHGRARAGPEPQVRLGWRPSLPESLKMLSARTRQTCLYPRPQASCLRAKR